MYPTSWDTLLRFSMNLDTKPLSLVAYLSRTQLYADTLQVIVVQPQLCMQHEHACSYFITILNLILYICKLNSFNSDLACCSRCIFSKSAHHLHSDLIFL